MNETDQNKTRFDIENNVHEFDQIKRNFESLKIDYPYLAGIGFFGSVSKGKDTGNSDLDICIFYNSENVGNCYENAAEWSQILARLHEGISHPFDHRLLLRSGGLRINISYARTLSDLTFFHDMCSSLIKCNLSDQDIVDELEKIPATQNLCSRFFLCIGDELYQNRKMIIATFRDLFDGKRAFRLLMKCINSFENFDKHKNSYDQRDYLFPVSIEEAEKYFFLKS